jgi:hypothetical protein
MVEPNLIIPDLVKIWLLPLDWSLLAVLASGPLLVPTNPSRALSTLERADDSAMPQRWLCSGE